MHTKSLRWPKHCNPLMPYVWLYGSRPTDMQPEILRKPDNKTPSYHFKHTFNDDNGIGRRKQQKPAYRTKFHM